MTDLTKIKDNIRAMLNLARNDGAADGEIQNAMNFATKLMNQHNLSEEDLGSVDEKIIDLENAELGKAASFSEGKNRSAWEAHLGHFVCEFVGGVKFYMQFNRPVKDHLGLAELTSNGRQRYGVEYTFYGLHEDALIAKTVYDEMVITVAAMGRLKYGSVFRGDGRNYCEGFIVGMYERLEEANRLEASTAASQVKLGFNANALMVIDQRALVVKKKAELPAKYLAEKGVYVRKRASRIGYGQYNGDARDAGITDGKKAQVSGARSKRLST